MNRDPFRQDLSDHRRADVGLANSGNHCCYLFSSVADNPDFTHHRDERFISLFATTLVFPANRDILSLSSPPLFRHRACLPTVGWASLKTILLGVFLHATRY